VVAISVVPQVVILTGGAGTRLRPLTAHIQKCLAPVAGRPFLSYVLDSLYERGINRVLLCTGHLAGQVRDCFGDCYRDIRLTYSTESQPLGTLGALRHAAPLLDDAFVLRYGDSWLPEPIDTFTTEAAQLGEPAAMAVLHNENRWDRSNVAVDGSLVQRYECKDDQAHPDPEPLSWIDYGMIALEKHLLSRTASSSHAPLFRQLAEQGELAAVPVQQRFYEIGTPASYREFCALVQAKALT
jgi:NDP-sugar pyrophosphorylase family protein